jgi:hypothetical protein
MDVDHSHDLTLDEFEAHLAGTQLELRPEEVDRLIAHFTLIDTDGDMRISYHEFYEFLSMSRGHGPEQLVPQLFQLESAVPVDIAVALVAFSALSKYGEFDPKTAKEVVNRGTSKWPKLEAQLALAPGILEGLVCGARKDVEGLKRAVRLMLGCLPTQYELDSNFVEGFMSIATDGTAGIEDMAVRLNFDPEAAEALVLVASGDAASVRSSSSVATALMRLGLDAASVYGLVSLVKLDLPAVDIVAVDLGLGIPKEYLAALMALSMADSTRIDQCLLPLARLFGVADHQVSVACVCRT